MRLPDYRTSFTPYFEMLFLLQVLAIILFTTLADSFIQRLIILPASTGHMWISRWRVLPLLRQYIMHFKSTHRCSVPYFAT